MLCLPSSNSKRRHKTLISFLEGAHKEEHISLPATFES